MNPSDPDHIDPENAAVDGMMREYARTGSANDDERLIDSIEQRIDQAATTDTKVSPWLFGSYFWTASVGFAAILLLWVGLPTIKSFSQQAITTELVMVSQSRFVPGGQAMVRGLIRNGKELLPLGSRTVQVQLVSQNGETIDLGEAVSDDQGMVFISTTLPEDIEEGDYELRLLSDDEISVAKKIPVQRSFRTLLSTDKPLYQPGQTIHMRALSLGQDELQPAANREVKFEIRDPKGNKVFGKTQQTSAYGIAAADFQLADQVNEGNYSIEVTIDDTSSERSVTVERYTLPKYKIDISTDRSFYAPADQVEITIDTQYTFGQPVAGAKVSITADEYIEKFRTFETLTGRTDENGQLSIKLPLKDAFVGQPLNKGDAFVRLTVEITDQANHVRSATKQVTVTNQPIRIEVFPESGKLVQNVENKLYLVTAYPDGTPAKTTIQMGDQSIQTSEMGIASVGLKPTEDQLKLTLEAKDDQGVTVKTVKKLRIEDRSQDVLLRTNRAIYDHGQSIELDIFSASPTRRVFIDVVKNGRSLSTQSVVLKDGRGNLVIDTAADMIGTLQIQAYSIDTSGEMSRDTKVVQVNRKNDLAITATLDKQSYRPAEKAVIKFLVTNSDGTGTQSALSLAAVDEAVFALQQHRPGMEEMYFLIQEEILKPRYQFTTMPGRQMTTIPNDDLDNIPEADIIVYSGVAGNEAAPSTSNSETFQDRDRVVKGQKREQMEKVVGVLPWLPLSLIGFCAIGLSVFTWRQLMPSQSLVLTDAKLLNQFRWKMRWVFVAFLASILLPLIIVFIFGSTGLFRDEAVAGFLYGLLSLGGVIGLFFTIRWVKENLPLYRFRMLARCLYSLIGMVILSTLAFVLLVFVAENVWNESQFITACSLLGLSVAISSAAILCWWWRLTKQGSLSRRLFSWFWRFSLILFLLSIPVLIGFTASSMSYLKSAAESVVLQEGGEGAYLGSSVSSGSEPKVRKYFPETLLWQPQLITDQNGGAELELSLADSITTWRLSASAVSKTGELGAMQKGIRVFQDFFIDIDFPVELTQSDEISVPIAIYNYLDREQTFELDIKQADWFEFTGDFTGKESLSIPANSVANAVCHLRALNPGNGKLTVLAKGTELSDAVERSVLVKPNGQRIETVINGRFDQSSLNQNITIPESAIAGGNDLFVKIYPGSFSQVVEGLDSIFRMPHGCFEQTSSTTYPNILTLKYIQETGQSSPELEAKALNFINIGYQRLLSFEVDGGGFSWFGDAPANTVLTAYGLMEFLDMNQLYEVDSDLINRTRKWLMSERNADGSWSSPTTGIAEGAINNFQGEQKLRTTAYLAWAILQAEDQSDLGKTEQYLLSNYQSKTDPYTLALCGHAFRLLGNQDALDDVLTKLEEQRQIDESAIFSWWQPQGEGITYGRGESFTIETTALVAQLYVAAKYNSGASHQALSWLIDHKDSRGTWHSTQATVLTMRALLDASTTSGLAAIEDELNLSIQANGELAFQLLINEENADVFHLVSLSEYVQTGHNEIAIEMDQESNLAYQIVSVHYQPHSEKIDEFNTLLSIDTEYSTVNLAAEDELTVVVALQYNRPEQAPMTLVDLGIPPGFEIVPGSLQALIEQGLISKYTVNGRQVSLYFEQIAGGGKETRFEYRLKARYPVKVQAEGATAYQYYEPEVRDTSDPVQLEVE